MNSPDSVPFSAVESGFPIPVLKRSVVLVGLMGAGKSSIGRRMAKTLDVAFFDSDDEIVKAADCSISDIFEIYGEAIFRDLERRVIKRLLTEERPCVIATGGGAFIQEKTREIIKEKAFSIWLKADLDILYERVSRKANRPLLEKGDKREILAKLMQERDPFYAHADITVHSDSGAHENVVADAIKAIHLHFSDTALS